MATTTARHLFTVHDYARMREAGIFTEDDRVELLDGEIYHMSPIGPLHVGLVNRLNRLLIQLIGDTGITSVQNPIRLNEYGEPQPDIAILKARDNYYVDALATPDDVLLVIEVADSSLDYDRDTKLPRYAAAGICEVWLLDVGRRVITQYTQPVAGEYTVIHKVLYKGALQATLLPAVYCTTEQIFG